LRTVLFLCSQNRLRSPTAEQIYSTHPDIEVSSAGLDDRCDNPLTPDMVEWADIIFVMEKAHRTKLSRRFKPYLKRARIVCLGIPDDYGFMDPALIKLLQLKVFPHLC
jgi:predicted protein tyrosine phosphatase